MICGRTYAGLLAFMLLTAPGAARADFLTGNALYELFNGTSASDKAMATAYVIGVIDGSQNMIGDDDAMGVRACFPASVTSTQIADVAKKRLEDSPKDRHVPAAWIVMLAVSEAFPCKTGG